MGTATRFVLAASAAVIGLVIGSFLATLVVRWSRRESIVRGRSRCDLCERTLGVAELVPAFGFALLRGHCRGCGGRIDRRHIVVELGCALVGGVAMGVQPGWEGAGGAVMGWLLLALAVLDIGLLWLPDALTGPLLLTGLAAARLNAPPALGDRLLGCVAGYLLLELVRRAYRWRRRMEGMGRGDPKLMAAIGAWLGWQALPQVLFGAACLGLLWIAALAFAGRPLSRRMVLPFGALLAISAWASWLILPLSISTP